MRTTTLDLRTVNDAAHRTELVVDIVADLGARCTAVAELMREAGDVAGHCPVCAAFVYDRRSLFHHLTHEHGIRGAYAGDDPRDRWQAAADRASSDEGT